MAGGPRVRANTKPYTWLPYQPQSQGPLVSLLAHINSPEPWGCSNKLHSYMLYSCLQNAVRTLDSLLQTENNTPPFPSLPPKCFWRIPTQQPQVSAKVKSPIGRNSLSADSGLQWSLALSFLNYIGWFNKRQYGPSIL